MNGYNFTERVRKVLGFAREEAAALKHEYVGTEHILLALIREGGGVAMSAVTNLDVTGEMLHDDMLRLVKSPSSGARLGPDIPYTSRAKRVLELAMSEARELDHAYVGTEHLLLGLVREEKGIAAQVLVHRGLTLDRVRQEVLRLLGDGRSDGPGAGAFAGGGTSRSGMIATTDPWGRLPEPTRRIVAAAFASAEKRGRKVPGESDLLNAVIFSSREVAAAFAARDIDVPTLIAEIGDLTDTP